MEKYFQKIFLFTYSFLLFTTPLIMYHKTSELFEFNKMLFIYLATFIIASLWVAKMILYKKIIIKKTVFDIPILLFFFSQILSTVFSIDQHTSIFGYYGRFNGGLFSVISYIILFYGFVSNFDIDVETSRRDVSALLKASLLSSLFVILWGLPGRLGYDFTCYLFTGVLNNSCWTDQFRPAERMFSTLGQPNWLGAYLAINFFISLYFLFKNFKIKFSISQFLNFLISVIIFSAILFTRSRSALLAIIVGLCLFPVFFVLRRDVINHISNILIKRFIILVLLLLIPIFLFKTGIPNIDRFLDPKFYLNKFPISIRQLTDQFPNKHPIINNPALPAGRQLPISSSDVTESGDIRKIVWKGAIDLGFKYPAFGTGVETFAYSYYFVRPKEHNLTSEWDFIYNKAHNEYLNYLATTGFLGLGTYLLMITAVIIKFFKQLSNFKNLNIKNSLKIKNLKFKIDETTDYQLLITCLLLAYLSILITNFFGFSTTTVNLYFYLLPALLIAVIRLKQSNNGTIKQSIISPSLFQKLLLVFPITICLAGAIFVTGYFLADTNYALADNYQKIQDYPQAYLYLNKALLYKNEHVYEDKLSNILANLAFLTYYEKNKNVDTDQLIKLADFYNFKSIKASPKNVLYWKTRAKNYYLFYQVNENDKNFQQAVTALETAKTLSPTDPKIYYSQAMLYLIKLNNNNQSKVLGIVDKAIELKPNYRDGYYAKGLILKQLKRKEEANKVFQYILDKLNPNDEEVKKELSSF